MRQTVHPQNQREYGIQKISCYTKCYTMSSKVFFSNKMNALGTRLSLKRDNIFLNLSPFYDTETGTIRVGGRLAQGQFKDSKKFPYLISKACTLAVLILRHCHEATLHDGGLLTLNTSREEFWLLNGKDTTRRVIKDCVICSRFENKPPIQMADLPMERITVAKSFQTVGLDLAGPIFTKPKVKTYIAVIVCFVTKAVHIELVENLTKEACMSAIERFTTRRGLPQKLFSDNKRSFIGTRNDMIRPQERLNKDGNEINWQFRFETRNRMADHSP